MYFCFKGPKRKVIDSRDSREHFGPQLPPTSVPAMVKSKKRSIDTVDDANLPVYNAGNRRGPPSQRYVEVTSTQIMEDAWKKKTLLGKANLKKKELVMAFGAPSFK